jgi:hypothetical protein
MRSSRVVRPSSFGAGGLGDAFGSSVLVLSPHPDDEVVGFACALSRLSARGGRAAILHLTEGIPSASELFPWDRRRRSERVARRRDEALASARFLGASVAGFLPIPSRRLKDRADEAMTAISSAIAEFDVDAVWVPCWEGGHQDHDAAALLASLLPGRLSAMGVGVPEFFEAPLYGFAGGSVRCQEFPPRAFPVSGMEWSLSLSEKERSFKRALLSVYASERGNLGYVGTEREGLRSVGGTDFSRPPHEGTPFWRRFGWVPFPHPRIDSTSQEDVLSALARFGERERSSWRSS